MESQSEYMKDINKRTKPEGSGVKKGFKKLDGKTAFISMKRCHPDFKEKLLKHLDGHPQSETEFVLEAINARINKENGYV